MKRLILIAALLASAVVQAGELKLEIEGKGVAGNQIRIGIYSAMHPEQFPSDQTIYRGIVQEATSDHLTVTVPDLPQGKYAVAAYIDSNRNGRQDRNLLGIPKEDFGFSNEARGKFGPPDFAEAAFEIGEKAVTQFIHLH